MPLSTGPYALEGSITLRTSRDGLAAQAGHDLTIHIARWSGELVIGADFAPVSLDARVELDSLVVRAGTGGIKPLTDRDRREILGTARKVLSTDRHPVATFTADGFSPTADGGTIEGALTLAGQSRPLRLEVRQIGPDRYLATTTVRQTSFGIKPYSGFLGALKVSDDVAVEAEVGLTPLSG
ncbi:MAG TPA: YceI family protein [Streptosporangiaceae bacterium]|nr:YceI family protein [Streptosporangiaceae bacterium]